MRGLIWRWIINGIALWVAVAIVNRIQGLGGIRMSMDLTTLLVVAAIFGLVNALVRPILELLTCPLIALTLGLFILIINGLLLMLTGWLASQGGFQFQVMDFPTAVVAALIVSIVSFILALAIHN